MKRIVLTGATGQVGWELQRSLASLGEVIAIDRGQLDLTDMDAIRRVILVLKPDTIVNAAAYTAVDQAEQEPDVAMKLNALAPGVMAEVARELGAQLVHYSTDYVFDGTKDGPYTESDAPCPINVYGRTKLAGERAIQAVGCRHLILRVCWVYGLRGKNFLRTILRLADERDELRIIGDQVGAPTWSRMIAEATALALACKASPEGLFHLCSGGSTSWHGFTRGILDLSRDSRKREPVLTSISTQEYPLPAPRPGNSRMTCVRFASETGIQLPDWHHALRLCLDR